MVFIQQIAAEKRALAWYLRTYSKFSFRRIAEECGISKSSTHRICSDEFWSGSVTRIPRAMKRGRPGNVSERKMRLLIRTLKSFGRNNVHVTVRSLVEESGLSFQVASRRTYSRYLNELGYYYFSVRRKGFLVTMIKKCDCNLHVTWSKSWLEILISGKMKFLLLGRGIVCSQV